VDHSFEREVRNDDHTETIDFIKISRGERKHIYLVLFLAVAQLSN
jgi:hypothetical protein